MFILATILCPRSRWGVHRAPQSLSCILGALVLRGKREGKTKGGERRRWGVEKGEGYMIKTEIIVIVVVVVVL